MFAATHSLQPDRRKFLAGAGIAAAGLAIPLASSASRWAAPKPLPPVAATPVPAAPDLAMPRLFPRALAALDAHGGRISHRDRVGVVDFAQASREPRFHLVDLANGDVTSHLVAHGSGSDPDRSGWLHRFSNQPDSNASSRGAFLTSAEYVGKHGRSRRLIGLDRDNNMAEPRAIVIHAADYVSEAMAAAQGLIGRSQGCFAFTADALGDVMDRLGPGRLIFAWK
ncbi:murein L,D-transpeptidase catalytic domain family protein [Altererythrobacter sp. TH136]|uniref:murein L,D-transpeptidase catalytic domain family protein n=1 Tax=Altererythrobacter sp. TH136 TaxID=2067415 RepID=UPI001165AE84|nr:murein L,D-transpeptidase catalytic domain family protein [Altererythrobacter sp. TH136]QDM40852.1 murein L,D-transpeptidase catalytic domain family protein [Altererythrobacter sp. TH136]